VAGVAAPAWLCLDWLSYFGRTRRASQQQLADRVSSVKS